MTISDLQTLDYLLKQYLVTSEEFKDRTIKILLNCDGEYWYGDLIEGLKDRYVIKREFSDWYDKVESVTIGSSNDDESTAQIDNLYKSLYRPKSVEAHFLYRAINESDDLIILQKYIEKAFPISGENKLDKLLFNAISPSLCLPHPIPYIKLERFNKIEFVSLIEL